MWRRTEEGGASTGSRPARGPGSSAGRPDGRAASAPASSPPRPRRRTFLRRFRHRASATMMAARMLSRAVSSLRLRPGDVSSRTGRTTSGTAGGRTGRRSTPSGGPGGGGRRRMTGDAPWLPDFVFFCWLDFRFAGPRGRWPQYLGLPYSGRGPGFELGTVGPTPTSVPFNLDFSSRDRFLAMGMRVKTTTNGRLCPSRRFAPRLHRIGNGVYCAKCGRGRLR